MQRAPVRPPRLHCEAALSPGASIELPERAARHVAALRLKRGDEVVLFNGDGSESSATLVAVSKRGTVAAVRERRAIDRESPLEIHLAQGICAGERMNVVLQKATELGVASIQPLVTLRSSPLPAGERAGRRLAHWRQVAIAACEQCGRNRVPEVAPPRPFANWLREWAGSGILLVPGARQSIASIDPRASPLALLIGPEGGFDPREAAAAQAKGFEAIALGPRVLRTETAAAAGLALVQARWGDLR